MSPCSASPRFLLEDAVRLRPRLLLAINGEASAAPPLLPSLVLRWLALRACALPSSVS